MNKWNAIYLSFAFVAIAVFFVGERNDGVSRHSADSTVLAQHGSSSAGTGEDRQLAAREADSDWYADAAGPDDDAVEDEGFDGDEGPSSDAPSGNTDDEVRQDRPVRSTPRANIIIPPAPPPVLHHSGARIRSVGEDMIER